MALRLEIDFAARVYFDSGERIGLAWIKDQIETLPVEGNWQAVARGTLRTNLFASAQIRAPCCRAGAPRWRRVDRWLEDHSAAALS